MTDIHWINRSLVSETRNTITALYRALLLEPILSQMNPVYMPFCFSQQIYSASTLS